MFIVFLRFSGNRSQAGQLMQGHKEWIQRGLDEDVFLVVGGLQPNQGGAIMAHNTSLQALEERVKNDPFVAQKVVDAEILEVTPARTDERLSFLLQA